MLTGSSAIRGNLGPDGNLEAVVYLPAERRLQHYWRGPKIGEGWRRGFLAADHATGPGCLIQNSVGSPGSLEAIALEGDNLVHYLHDFRHQELAFGGEQRVASGATGPATLVQNRTNQNLEVIGLFGTTLRHYSRPSSGLWQAGAVISTKASGPATLIQSDYDNRLECVIREGSRLVLYYQETGKWIPGGTISRAATGTAGFVQGTAGGEHKNFEVVVPEGDCLQHYWRDNSRPDKPWRRGATVAAGGAAFVASSLFVHKDGTLGILAQEGSGSVFEYGQDGGRWQRVACLHLDEGAFLADRTRPQSEKVAPVTQGNPRIQGTDLGASFEHRGRLYFLFGDTFRASDPPHSDWDAIAVTDATSFADGFPITFHRSYPKIVGPEVPQGAFAVPADGFSYDGHLYTFFTTDQFTKGRVMGRSVLSRCREDVPNMDSPEPLLFDNLGTFSDRHFINLSAEVVNEAQIAQWGLPRVAPQGLLLWGTGTYRVSDIRLAFLPLVGDLRNRRVLYYAGEKNWKTNEEDAVPLFSPGAVGELSVRWNPTLNRFVLLYGSGHEDPIGLAVQMRVSKTPQGPWSQRRLVLDWQRDALGKYMHLHGTNDGLDNGSGSGGAAYAPYQIVRATEKRGDGARLHYLLSCWNPYQVVLLRHDITGADIAAMERRPG